MSAWATMMAAMAMGNIEEYEEAKADYESEMREQGLRDLDMDRELDYEPDEEEE